MTQKPPKSPQRHALEVVKTAKNVSSVIAVGAIALGLERCGGGNDVVGGLLTLTGLASAAFYAAAANGEHNIKQKINAERARHGSRRPSYGK